MSAVLILYELSNKEIIDNVEREKKYPNLFKITENSLKMEKKKKEAQELINRNKKRYCIIVDSKNEFRIAAKDELPDKYGKYFGEMI